MLDPADLSFALIALGISVTLSEVLLVGVRWRATLRTRAMLAGPLWAFIMGIYLVFRLTVSWATM